MFPHGRALLRPGKDRMDLALGIIADVKDRPLRLRLDPDVLFGRLPVSHIAEALMRPSFLGSLAVFGFCLYSLAMPAAQHQAPPPQTPQQTTPQRPSTGSGRTEVQARQAA